VDTVALAAELSAMEVRPVDPTDRDRAALYLPELRAMRNFFNPAPNQGARAAIAAGGLGGLGAHYDYFKPALTNPNLLNELAKVLDFFVGAALDQEMIRLNTPVLAVPTTAAFYANHIFDPVDATYVANRNQFLAIYPVTQAALAQLSQNFRQNIILACERVNNDRARIQGMFAVDYPHLSLLSLQQIKSTGSDFHKGGKQVLILFFSARYWYGLIPKWTTFRLVYKPSDIEIDSLIAGDSQAINAVTPNFVPAGGSLVELFNVQLDALHGGAPLNQWRLPTYKILPCNWMSNQAIGAPPFATLRDLYGYIEFLTFEEAGFGEYDDWDQGVPTWYNAYWPFGASDFTLFGSLTQQEYEGIIQKVYRQFGQLAALACTFAIVDMHMQNVRVHAFQAYLIDLEISLSDDPIQNVQETMLIDPATGGIDGYDFQASKFKWQRVAGGTHGFPAYDSLRRNYEREKFQNRLYRLSPARQLVAPEPFSLCQGIADGLTALANAPLGYFNAWWARLANVLVRDLPYVTSDLQQLQRQIFINGGQLVNALPVAVQNVTNNQFVQDQAAYVAPAEPKYMALAAGVADPDYTSLDLPIYYRRVDQLDIVDSRGNAVPLPGPPFPRITYYAAGRLAPLQAALANISGGLNAGNLANRIGALQTDITNALNNGAIPGAPQFNFLPI
jgi:hypothetical protein